MVVSLVLTGFTAALLLHVSASLYAARRALGRGASWYSAFAIGLFGFLIVPLAALFLTGLLGDFAANWINDTRTIQRASVVIFPVSVMTMWAYQLAYWHYTRHLHVA